MALLKYQCPNCDGPLGFDPGTQEIVCPYCGSMFSVEALQSMDEGPAANQDQEPESAGWDYHGGGWGPNEQQGLAVYTCKSCAGEIVGDETLGATSCPFCGNQVVITSVFTGTLRPDLVIPFKLDKNAAVASLQKHYGKNKLLPATFRDENHLEEVKGVYVPFWLFDADADARIEYSTTKVRHWSDRKYVYTETSNYDVIREGVAGFCRVPVDGSKAISDELMESIEPYSMADAVDFRPAYLAGFFANKYDVSADESAGRANERIRDSVTKEFAKTVTGYHSVKTKSTDITLRNREARYALLPVWLLSTSWQGENFLSAMNGQTGKFVGNLPYDAKAKQLWFRKIFGVAAAVLVILPQIVIFLLKGGLR